MTATDSSHRIDIDYQQLKTRTDDELFDVEGQVEPIMEFTEKSIRRGFIRKVYAIVLGQLFVTGAFIALFMFKPEMRLFMEQNDSLVLLSFVLLLVVTVTICVSDRAKREFPWNFIFLGIFTVIESFFVGAITSLYEVESVLLAVGITTIMCTALTVYAFKTDRDFTGLHPYLFMSLFGLILFGLAASLFGSYYPFVQIVYAAVGAVIFCGYLIFDTQLIVGGKHKKISAEDYTFAAILIYLDIINILIKILRIVGKKK